MQNQVDAINSHLSRGKGMDVIIVSTSSIQQQTYWKERFKRFESYLFKPGAIVLTVLEDWAGGAGNGLGTLHAFQKAKDLAMLEYGIDLDSVLRERKSIAMYHTAGYGQRLAPLTCSELNNKSAIRLPSLLGPQEKGELITILEAVIKQTAIFSECNQGRLSVFWGDQIFIPEHLPTEPPNCHVEILANFSEVASKEAWLERGLDSYGLVTRFLDEQERYNFQVTDRLSYDDYITLIAQKKLRCDTHLGISLGCFSLSEKILKALLDEFSEELTSYTGKIDTDPDIWMPSTVSLETYFDFTDRRGLSREEAEAHHNRLRDFLNRFVKSYSGLPFFGARDIGQHSYWWDYGTCINYHTNNLKLLENSAEAIAMRTFYGLENALKNHSIVVNSSVDSAQINKCIMINVHAHEVKADKSVLINVVADKVEGENCLLYNAFDQGIIKLPDNGIRADLFILERTKNTPFYSDLTRNSKKDWKERLQHNWCSYEDACIINAGTDQEEVRREARAFKEAVLKKVCV